MIATSIKNIFLGEGLKFHSGGREDIDVRMLGTGRPFVVEVLNPKRRTFTEGEFKDLEKVINEATELVAVNSLCFTDHKCFEKLTEAADSKVKAYAAII